MNKQEENKFFLASINDNEFLEECGEMIGKLTVSGRDEILPAGLKQVVKGLTNYFDVLLLDAKEEVSETVGIYKKLPIVSRKYEHIYVVLPTGDVLLTNRKVDYIAGAVNFTLKPWTPDKKIQEKYDKLLAKHGKESVADAEIAKQNSKYVKETTAIALDFKKTSLFLYWQLRLADGKKLPKSPYTGRLFSELLYELNAASTAEDERYRAASQTEGYDIRQDKVHNVLYGIAKEKEKLVNDFCKIWIVNQMGRTYDHFGGLESLFCGELLIKNGKEKEFLKCYNTVMAELIRLNNEMKEGLPQWRKTGYDKKYLAWLFQNWIYDPAGTKCKFIQKTHDFFYSSNLPTQIQVRHDRIITMMDELTSMVEVVHKSDIYGFIKGEDDNIPDMAKEFLYYMRACERPKEEKNEVCN